MSAELIQAIEQHNLKRLAALLSSGADPNVGERPEWNPLKQAIDSIADGGPIEALVLLLRHGAKVDGEEDPGNATPLLVAALNKQLEAARFLLAAGADPSITDDEGDSPLRVSVEGNDLAMAELLLLCGADKTIHSFGGPSGFSALGRAIWLLNVPMIELLLRFGANPEVIDLDYRHAWECLPPRETSDPQVWDAVMALIKR